MVILGFDPSIRSLFIHIVSLLLEVLVIIIFYYAALKSKLYSRQAEIAWLLILASQFFLLTNAVILLLMELWFKIPTGNYVLLVTSLPNTFYIIFLSTGLILLPKPEMSHFLRMRRIADIGIILSIFFLFLWIFIFDPIVNFSETSDLTMAVTAAFVASQFALAYVACGVLLRNAGQLKNRPASFLLASVFLQIFTLSLFSYQAILGQYFSGGLVDFLWLVVFVLLGLAAVLQITQRQPEKVYDCYKRAWYMNLSFTEYIPAIFAIIAYLVVIWVYFNKHQIFLDIMLTASIIVALAIFRQILSSKAYKRSSRLAAENQRKLQAVFDNSSDAIIIASQDGVIIQWNKGAEKMFGYSAEEAVGHGVEIILPDEYIEGYRESFSKMISGEMTQLSGKVYEFSSRRKDGTEFPVEVSMSFWPTDEDNLMAAIIRDISERKKSEESLKESEEKFRGVFNNANDAIFLHPVLPGNVPGNFIEVNDVACQMLGYTYEELLKKGPKDIDAPEYEDKILNTMDELMKKTHTVFEVVHLTKDGQKVPVEIKSHVFQFRGQDMILSIARDITTRKIHEEQMEKSLEEKELLLKEIHHRVKNHLQIISSLIRLQSMGIDDDKTSQYFIKIQNRVRTIALLHENLYQSRDASHVNFKAYVEKILNNLSESYRMESKKIDMISNIESLALNIETASTCGLIINEIITNCMKHAFPNKNKGEIFVEFKDDEGQYHLIIADNGIGFPEGLDHQKTKTLGLMLINNLVMQLGGILEVRENHGTVFKISFQELRYKKRI